MATVYVLGTFDDPLEALTDFAGHAILISVAGTPTTDTEQIILDRDTDCGINETVPILCPPTLKATAFAADGNAALLRAHCADPVDCPDLDRAVIRSNGCHPPRQCEIPARVFNRLRPPSGPFYPPKSEQKITRNWNLGYAVSTGLAYDISFENTTVLTNYVDVPFQQLIDWRADISNPGVSYRLWYQGIVRIWESGTIQFIGQIKFVDNVSTPTALTDVDYNVWFGQTGQPGSLETVANVPTDGAWYDVNWSGKPGALEHCEIIYGNMPQILGELSFSAELVKYPDGLVIPDDPPHVFGGSAGAIGVTACGLTRDGNDIDGEWAITPSAFTTQHYISTVELDSSDWSNANAITHLNASTLGGSLAGTFSRTIPDSATVGLWIRIWNASTNVNTGTFDIGPFFRLAYAPTVQQGVDPL